MELYLKFIKRVGYFLVFVAMICTFCISLFTTIDVSFRFVLGKSVEGSIEVCEVLMVLIAFLGLTWADVTNTHVEVKFLVEKFPNHIKKSNELFVKVLTTACLGLFSYASIKYAIEKFIIDEVIWVGTKQMVLWPARFSLVLGIFVLFLYYLGKLVSILTDLMATHKQRR